MGSIVFTGVGFGVDDLYSHNTHQISDSMSPCSVTFLSKHTIQLTRSKERIVSVKMIKGLHKEECIRRYYRDCIETGTSDVEKLRLTSECECRMILINQNHSCFMGRSHQVQHIFF
jgi:hypothetical protein